jgi:hypothetical protein
MPNLGTSTITAAALATKMAARLAAMAARGSVFGAMGSWKTSTSADLKTQPATASITTPVRRRRTAFLASVNGDMTATRAL